MPRTQVFEALTIEELRDLYREHPNQDIRRVILQLVEARRALEKSEAEVTRLRVAILKIEELRQVIDRAWKDQVGGHLVGLESLRVLLQEQRVFMGYLFK